MSLQIRYFSFLSIGLDYDDERFLIHFYDTFYNANIKFLGCTVRCRVNVLYHLLAKIGKEPNADLFQFMKEASHQCTEEGINLVFKNLGWNYSPVPAPALTSKVSLSPSTATFSPTSVYLGPVYKLGKKKSQSNQLYLDC